MVDKIDLDFFGLFAQGFIDQIGNPIDIKHIIVFFGLIQKPGPMTALITLPGLKKPGRQN